MYACVHNHSSKWHTMLMQWSSCGPPYLNLIRCLCISEKYSFASLEVEVPKPVKQHDIQHHETQRNNSLRNTKHYISVRKYNIYHELNTTPLHDHQFLWTHSILCATVRWPPHFLWWIRKLCSYIQYTFILVTCTIAVAI